MTALSGIAALTALANLTSVLMDIPSKVSPTPDVEFVLAAVGVK